MTVPWWAWAIGGWYACWSLAAFTAFAVDKRAAERGTRRVAERSLHVLEALGGWPGAWVAMGMFRHKSRKTTFKIITAVVSLAHCAGWIWLAMR